MIDYEKASQQEIEDYITGLDENVIKEHIQDLKKIGRNLSQNGRVFLVLLEQANGKPKKNPRTINTQAKFAKDASNENRIKFIEIDLIDNDETERVGEDETLEELGEDIEKHGLWHPVVIEELPNGRYRKLIGRRRIKAHKLRGLKKIKAIIVPLNADPYERNLIVASENNHRKNYNDFEEVSLHITQLSLLLKCESEKAKVYIGQVNNFKKGTLKQLDQNIVDAVEKVVNDLKIFKTVSTLNNKLPVLNLQPLLLDNLIRGNLSYKVARLIDSYSAKLSTKVFNTAILQIVNDKLGYDKALEYLKTQLAPKVDKSVENKIVKDYSTRIRSINNNQDSFSKLPQDKQTQILHKLQEIQNLLNN